MLAPVASSARSKRTVVLCASSAVFAAGSSFITLVRVSSSMLLLAVPLVRVQVRVVGLRLAAQQVLRARRALVGRMRLAAHEQHRPVEALLAQPLGARRAGEAAAHDQDVDVALGHQLPVPVADELVA